MTSLFKLFATSKTLEKEGIWVDYGEVKFLIARAGGANIAYADLLKAKIRPIRNKVDRDLLTPEEDTRISAELYAEVVIKAVQVKGADGTWSPGVPTEDGKVLPFTVANVTALLLELPEMFRDLKNCANDSNKFLKGQEDADLKNSNQS